MLKKHVVKKTETPIVNKPHYTLKTRKDTARYTFSNSTQVILDQKTIDGCKVTAHSDCKDNGYHYIDGCKVFSVKAPNGEITTDKGCTTVCSRLGWVENVSKPAHTAKWLNANGYTTINGQKFGGK